MALAGAIFSAEVFKSIEVVPFPRQRYPGIGEFPGQSESGLLGAVHLSRHKWTTLSFGTIQNLSRHPRLAKLKVAGGYAILGIKPRLQIA